MKIYRVVGNTGEYADSVEWTAKCFFDEDKASAFIEECETFVDWLMEEDEDGEVDGVDKDYEDICPRYYNVEDYIYLSPDKNIRVDYTGTYYYTEELEVED